MNELDKQVLEQMLTEYGKRSVYTCRWSATSIIVAVRYNNVLFAEAWHDGKEVKVKEFN